MLYRMWKAGRVSSFSAKKVKKNEKTFDWGIFPNCCDWGIFPNHKKPRREPSQQALDGANHTMITNLFR